MKEYKKIATFLLAASTAAMLIVSGCIFDSGDDGDDDNGGGGGTSALVATWKSNGPVLEDDDDRSYIYTLGSDMKVSGSVINYDWDGTVWSVSDTDAVTGDDDTYSTENGYIHIYTDEGTGTDRDIEDDWYKYAISGSTMTWDWAVVLTGGGTALQGTPWSITEYYADSTGAKVTSTVTITFDSDTTFTFIESRGGESDTSSSTYTATGNLIAMMMGNTEPDSMYYQITGGKTYIYNTRETITLTKQ